MTRKRAVFLDRDGVLNKPEIVDGMPFAPRSIDRFALFPDAVKALKALHNAGFVLVVVTNQPDVGNGLVARDIVEEMHRVMMQSMPVDRVFACFHTHDDHCSCRKPATGMLDQAIVEFNIDPKSSFMIGDRWKDIAAGNAADCATIFIDRGYSEPMNVVADHVVASTLQAAEIILAKGM